MSAVRAFSWRRLQRGLSATGIVSLLLLGGYFYVGPTAQSGYDVPGLLAIGTRGLIDVLAMGLLIAGLVPVAVGAALGCAGHAGLSRAVNWVWDVMEIFPVILIALVANYICAGYQQPVMATISVFLIPRHARIIQAATQRIMQREFVQIARMNGLNTLQIAWLHVLPLLRPTIAAGLCSCLANLIGIWMTIGYLEMALLPANANWGYVLLRHLPHSLTDLANPDFLLCSAVVLLPLFSLFMAARLIETRPE